LRFRWQRKIGTVMSITADRQLVRYAIIEPQSGQAVVRRVDDDRELLREPRSEFGFWHTHSALSPDGQHLMVFYLLITYCPLLTIHLPTIHLARRIA
jgi:hypothetical protein